MQLKLQRSQREGGVMSKSVIFCLDARVEFTVEEAANLKRYKMLEQVIYASEDAKRTAEGSAAAMARSRSTKFSADSVDDMLFSATAGIGGGLKAAALGALSAMKLRITVNSLQRGQHIECKSLDELLGAEAAVIEACKNLRVYLDTAATFDGREVLIAFNTEEPEVLASAPAPMLVAPTRAVAAQSTPVPKLAGPAVERDMPEELDALEEPVMYQTNLDGSRTPLVDNGWGGLERLIPWLASEWERDPRKVLLWGGVAVVALWIIISIIF